MSTQITGAEYPLMEIFSSHFDYEIPEFQRPYSWTEEEAGDLFDDLYDFFCSEPEEEQYFLGSIVLVKKTGDPHAEVIDGQQRLTTLTILMSALCSRIPSQYLSQFKQYILEEGNVFAKLEAKPRVHIRKRDNDFFRKYIQNMNIEELINLNPDLQDTEAKANIIKNAKLLLERIDDNLKTDNEIVGFGSFLVTRCFLVAVSTPSRQAAFRIFSVMNSRGMSLLATDIIKADVIGVIPDSIRTDYNNKWEEMEVEIGRAGFNDLFTHIRTIKAKAKARKSLQDEFKTFVLPEINKNTAIAFIDDVLEPYSEAYSAITSSAYLSTIGADAVNDILRWLNRIDNSDWVPVAMQFYVYNKGNPVLLNIFLRKLERLAAYMRAMSYDVTHRVERYVKVLADLENDPHSCGIGIELTEEERKEFVDALSGNVYRMAAKKRNYLILRLDSFVSDGAASYDSKILTIEHVMPQTIPSGSQWEEWWPNEEQRNLWLHKIGNLLPLAKRTNSQAQNYEFEIKKDRYFKGKSGTASFSLTTQVLNYQVWTPTVVEKRQAELLEIYKKNWEL